MFLVEENLRRQEESSKADKERAMQWLKERGRKYKYWSTKYYTKSLKFKQKEILKEKKKTDANTCTTNGQEIPCPPIVVVVLLFQNKSVISH